MIDVGCSGDTGPPGNLTFNRLDAAGLGDDATI